MGQVFEKFKEAATSVLPIVLIVLLLNFVAAPQEGFLVARFLLGAVSIIVGLGVFLFGTDLSIGRMGEVMGSSISYMKSRTIVFIFGTAIGFLITIAEPNLQVLAGQVAEATGGMINPSVMVAGVSIGFGLLVGYGLVRILMEWKLKNAFLLFYGLLIVMMFFTSDAFQALAYDAAGAATGALTTPFVLALALGAAKLKGSDAARDESFGLVGLSFVGPIAVMLLMGIIQKADIGGGGSFAVAEGVFSVFGANLKRIFFESIMALLPIAVIFYSFNAYKYKLKGSELKDISLGLVYTLIGLVLFLTGVNSGFMDMARELAADIAAGPLAGWMPLIGFILGLVVVLAEPAVYVLTHQVEDMTGGAISRKLLLTFLCVGVGLAVGSAMVRIMVPGLKFWMFIVPGYLLALIMARKSSNLFVGLGFDSGAVASGPMTATFILAFCQGTAASVPGADVVVDGFGVIAQVAMMPILMVLLLGMLVNRGGKKSV